MIEQQIIKHMLDKSNFDEYGESIKEEHIPTQVMWKIFKRLRDYYLNYTDPLSLDDLKAIHLSEMAGIHINKKQEFEKAYEDIAETNVSQACEELVRTARRNALLFDAQDAIDSGQLVRATELLQKAEEVDQDEITEFDQYRLTELQDDIDGNNKWKWAIPELEEHLDGFGAERSVLVYARPNTGKTSFISYNVVSMMRQGAKLLHFSISEDTKVALVKRYYQAAYHKKDEVIEANMEKASDAFERDFGGKFFLKNVATLTLKQAREYIEACRPDIVVFDQYQKVKVYHDQEARSDEVLTLVVQKLKELAKEFQFGLILATQADAKAENKKWLGMDNVAGSKTGVAGELQAMIGIGKDNAEGERTVYRDDGTTVSASPRYINIPKNKGSMGQMKINLVGDVCEWVS